MHNNDEIDKDTKKPEMIMDYNTTKGRVDTVDKLCASYSAKRVARRCPMVIFYHIMNIAGINTQILFTSGLPSEAADRRIFFLKNLAQDLMKEQLYAKSEIKNLLIDVKAFISLRFPKRSIEDVEEAATSSDAVPT
ncbi:piggyBac transposable element-derived protein 4-like [Diorhabda sublineata]|uniref:piggyBac transposable element-derived protein 4-like n=1 Tax=Diorhabda sublineata TaxID=1163346 RepID=UPI0024E0A8B7|nr:piggyBac transposable element-derived protein 4-like [Diorhabda sublineata]